MKKKLLTIGSYVLVAMLATVITLALVGENPPSKLDRLEALIENRFIGEADTQAMEDAAAAAMVKATGDRWSYYISAKDYDTHREQEENAYVGVGVTIQPQEDESGFLIIMVTDGSPAKEAGIEVNDLLIGVEDQDVRGMTTDEVGALVKGQEGTKVSLTVMRKGEHMTLSVERRRIEQPVAEGEMLEDGIGLVKISNFDARCAEETISAIEKLRSAGAKKLILDVRNNPGGFADELVKLLDYLLPEGDLFRSVSFDGKEQVDTSDENFLDMPMAVLVNGDSYSAAEFFAAALQEYEAAVVVGEPTVGKGYYQQTIPLGDGSAVALSTGKYFTPKGNSLADKGVIPTVRVDVDEETASAIYYGTLSAGEDPQLQAAIKALE
ncbi:MAG: S41 family peptidase [Candidatus Faecousia sp.]|nr:S41 family peptidase [Clostridiales bacterium]MCI6937417.1 S41 family peptidase [Clostridiales bacterium]MDD5883491.1 S41 family peptidase [Bacillota bacterium]MDY4599862.1 S41 family peptidase [Candidatus Faecousia sp.]